MSDLSQEAAQALYGFSAVELSYQVMTPEEAEKDRQFQGWLDRDLRDCLVWGWLLFDDLDAGGAMFEVGPVEIIRWRWEEAGIA